MRVWGVVGDTSGGVVGEWSAGEIGIWVARDPLAISISASGPGEVRSV